MKAACLFLIFIILSPRILNACEEPPLEMFWNISELLWSAREVYLVKLVSEKENETFKVIEVIAGPERKSIDFRGSYRTEYDSTTFNNHADSTFWKDWIGRSKFECCECFPQHTFKEGDMYLLFPEYYGARKYAERIVSIKEDKWFNYVKAYYGRFKK